MQTGIGFHASLFGVPKAVYDDIAVELEGLDEVEYSDGILRIWHEGLTVDVETLFGALVERAGTACEGGLDIIDHDEWTVTRYVAGGGVVTGKTIPLNEVLEGKSDEWGA